MSLYGKTPSAKRGKPSYVLAIVGVALILFLFGIVGWSFLNLKKLSEVFRENIEVHAWIAPTAKKTQIDSLQKYINALPYVKSAEYVTKEKAIQIYNAENDSSWKDMLNNNPLPESVDFFVKADFMNKDSLTKLGEALESNFPDVVSQFQYPRQAINNVSSLTKYVVSFILIVAIILSVIVIISIDNTIRLAMYSNRFIIKTMQMVGATRGFISRPMNVRAIINGLIAAGIAIAALLIFIFIVERYLPWFKVLRDSGHIFIIVVGTIILGVSISWFSTQRSVLKYLKMKLDDLY